MDTFGLIMAIISEKLQHLWYLDPGGALIIAVLMLISWSAAVYENAYKLLGRTADQGFWSKVVYVVVTDERVGGVGSVRFSLLFLMHDKGEVEWDW